MTRTSPFRLLARAAGILAAAGLLTIGCNPQKELTRKAINAAERGLMRAAYLKGLRPETLSLRDRMPFYRVPGVSLAVIDGNRVAWARAYGEKDIQTHQPLTTDTAFQGGAFSQFVASVAALRLADQGRLAIDKGVNAQLRSWQIPDGAQRSEILPRELMAHAAGLSDQVFSGYVQGEPFPSLLQILNGEPPANNGPVWAPPAHRFPTKVQYAESGYVVLQQLLEDVSSSPFPEFAQSSVFRPLKLTGSTLAVPIPEEVRSRAASGHLREGQVIPGLWRNYPEAAAKGLWTTPSDFAAVLCDLLRSATDGTGILLSPGMARYLLGPRIENAGFGFFVEGAGDDVNFNLRAKTRGYACYMTVYPAKGQGVVIMTNSENGFVLIQEILCGLSDAYRWPHFKPEEKAVLRLAPETYARFTGRYEIRPDYVLDVTLEDYYLVIRPTGQAATKFYAEGQTLFYSVDPYVRIQFLSDKAGRVESLILWQQDFELTAKKVN
jgi:CubicO group peptidase (beta-lactamase class C family)